MNWTNIPIKQVLMLVLVMAITSACSTVTVEQYANATPAMVPEDFFDGSLTAHGIVKSRGGKVIRHFNATIRAYWNEQGVGTLDERFEFDDGEEQIRVWTLQPLGGGRYKATANDVVGSSIASVAGNALFMDYVLQIQYRGRPLDITVKDRMYLVDPQTIINESEMRKFGFKVGSVTLTILRNE